MIILQHNLRVSCIPSLRTTAVVAIPKHHISLASLWTHKQFMTIYTSSEINVTPLGNLTVSVYDIHIYHGGTTPGKMWKKINVVETAEGCFNQHSMNDISVA